MSHRILVVGGGSGGTMTANLLARALGRRVNRFDVELTLCVDKPSHAFLPANLEVAFRGANPEEFYRREGRLLRDRVRLFREGAAHVDLDERIVLSREGRELSYDHLVLATGASIHPELLPGFPESGGLNFHQGPIESARIWEALKSFRGGNLVVAIGSVPHLCPPSPNEAAFLLDELLRKRGIRDATDLTLVTPYPRAYPSEAISEVITPLMEERGIGLETFFNADRVDPDGRVLTSLEGAEVPYDLLIAVPPHRGAEVILNSGIGDEEGWIPADKETMRYPDHPEVYSVGDATNIPISKSGVVAHLQSEVVAKNILEDLRRSGIEHAYNGRINCPMETGHHQGLFVAGTYAEPPKAQRPNYVRYRMKKEFGRMYWSTLDGSWEWLFRFYFGPTSVERLRTVPPLGEALVPGPGPGAEAPGPETEDEGMTIER